MTLTTSEPSLHPGLSIPFERATLSNGLKVILHPDRTLPLVTVNLWYHVGSKNERPGRTGFAHLFEHMLFQGSEHVPTNDHFRHIQQVGGVANGSTWYDRTNYYETLPSHHLDLGLWLESDRMGFLLPALTSETLETQRGVVMNERRQRVDNQPYGLAHERLHELLFQPDHPYHWPVIGYMDDIAAATLEEVRQFFRTYYAPNNAVLTLAGDLDPDQALRQVETWFGEIPAGPPIPPISPLASRPEPLGGERREVIEDDVSLPRVYMAFRAPSCGQRAWYAADLLATAMAGGKSSPLYSDLVYDRQIAQDISVWVSPFEEVGTFTLVSTARPGVDIGTLERAVLEHVDRFSSSPPDPADFERSRNRMVTELYSGLQKLDNRADLLSQFTTYFDDPGGVAREAERYLEVEPRELSEFAAAWCVESERAVVSVVPREIPREKPRKAS